MLRFCFTSTREEKKNEPRGKIAAKNIISVFLNRFFLTNVFDIYSAGIINRFYATDKGDGALGC